ncbi:armadillo-type protein [Blastocladiella britannica]|nr:armadillo-type protein [Blastocladiella britannica]
MADTETLSRENEQLRTKLKQLEQLSIEKIKLEMIPLQCICGRDPQRHALKWIDWESDYTFEGGAKCPPWRSEKGEIGYIVVKPFDADSFLVTATNNGYFMNKGYRISNDGNSEINYEPANTETFASLLMLVQSRSPHFLAYLTKSLREESDAPVLASVSKGESAPPGIATGGPKPGSAKGAASAAAAERDPNDDDRAEAAESKRNAYLKRKDEKKLPLNGGGKALEPSSKWKQITPDKNAERERRKKLQQQREPSPIRRSAKTRSGSPKSARRSRHRVMEDSGEESHDSEEEEMQDKRQDSEVPPEQWQIQKLVKYLKAGNQTATIIAICSLRDFDLLNENNQLAIRNVGGLEILVNLLDTDDPKCKIGSLLILNQISNNYIIRKAISELDGMRALVDLLHDDNVDVKCLAAETIANCAKYAKNRRMVRKYYGIRSLVRLLHPDPANPDSERIAVSGALALWTCSKSHKNKEAIRIAGSIPLLAELLKSPNEKLLIPVVGILQECASDEQYRAAIRTSGMTKFLVENLSSANEKLQAHCASAIFKCAEDTETRVLVREFSGITPIVALLDHSTNKELLAAATGAIWKTAQDMNNVHAYNKLNTIKKLVGLIEGQPEDVLVNVVGALAACAKAAEGRQAIRESGGITPLVGLLKGTNQGLLVNVTSAIGASALDADSMAIIDRLDGVRLLWSLLKSPNPAVQASAAWAISPCIENAKDAGEMVRSFVGGLELIVSLLKSEHIEVLASVCAAIAQISKDEENLAVITDHGVVPMLAKLTQTRHDRLRKHLAEAVARCCFWGNNRIAFGAAGAVAPLVKYLKSPDVDVHRATAQALHQLSKDPENCVTMHEHGVVQLLLGMVGSSDTVLQEAAAGTIGNIRRLALASEKAHRK